MTFQTKAHKSLFSKVSVAMTETFIRGARGFIEFGKYGQIVANQNKRHIIDKTLERKTRVVPSLYL